MPIRLAWLGLFAYAALFICLSLARFYGLKSQVMDLGTFDQLFWSMLHGSPFSTLDHGIKRAWFGVHFSPALYLLLPIYALAPHPETLLILNVLLVASGAIPVYLVARRWNITPPMALCWSIIFLVNPFVTGAMMWDFHEVALAVPAMGFALYAIATRRKPLFLLMCVLLLMCKEHYGLNVMGLGLLWAIEQRDARGGLTVAAFGLVGCLLIVFVIMPAIRAHDVGATTTFPLTYYTWLLHPDQWSVIMFVALAGTAIIYGGMLLAPFWLLPLWAPAWLLPTMGDVALNTASLVGYMRSPFSYHNAPILIALTLAALRAGITLAQKRPQLKLIEVTGVALIAGLAFGYASAPLDLPGARNIWEVHLQDLAAPYQEDINHIRAMLPPEKGVSTQSNIGAFFSERTQIYRFPEGGANVDTIVLHLHYPFVHLRDIFSAPFGDLTLDYIANVRRLLNSPEWRITYWHDDWLVLERNRRGIHVNKSEIGKALDNVRTAYLNAKE